MATPHGLLPPEGTDLNQPCVVRDVIDRVGDRWSLLIIGHLAAGPQRFNALQRSIGDISKQVLSRTLSRLEEDGFINRTVISGKPLQVVYELSNMGLSFLSPLRYLLDWAHNNQHAIAYARKSYVQK
ncbi:helix-turn-helix domain-containing protein [Kosakonia sp. MUSA4]|uniref:winged helix-turn-helix transcriptional regulator n=1 Tax=Kosakonia sp. MUSA4 TaxID=2067958 RepID=UPI0015993E3E|nr:helix-turn-helix domain-containing protein [Kosakonia sp. MUSA4]QJT79330.1 transcriptional regulator [Kosakonia sp. MUSA4]